MMDLNWAITLGILALLVVLGVIAWCVRGGNGRHILGAVAGSVFGSGSGFVILGASNQSGMASLEGFGLSILLGMIILALGIFGMISQRHRVVAFVVAGTMLAGAVASSQLLVAATRDGCAPPWTFACPSWFGSLDDGPSAPAPSGAPAEAATAIRAALVYSPSLAKGLSD